MAKKINGLSRDLIIHPGETLKEMLDDREMSQRELALRTGVTEPHISAIIKGNTNISITFAKKLEYALEVDAKFWVNLQSNYDKELADYEEINKISDEEYSILNKIKLLTSYLKELNMLDATLDKTGLVLAWRKLLNTSNLASIYEISQSGAYRLSQASNVDPTILFAWLKVAELISNNQQLNTTLNVEKLKDKMDVFKNLAFEDIDTIYHQLKKYLAECGIKFALIKHVTGAPVQGVITKNDDDTITLAMTLRQKYADIFWFTFFHEIGHIINSDINKRLIDYEDSKNESENLADNFSSGLLINPHEYTKFLTKSDFSINAINEFSSQLKIPNFIVIGRLQRDGYLAYNKFSNYKVKYDFNEIKIKHH